MKHGIAIVGGNGSGKTTLGKQLADLLGYKHLDIEDYYFKEGEKPYTNSRTKEEVQTLLLNDIKKYGKFVVSSVNCNFGNEINAYYDCIIYIEVPLDIRIERVKQRSIDKFGCRVLEGGDMYEQEQSFFEFVSSRTMDETNEWLKEIKIPIIYIDGTKSIEINIEIIKEYILNNS